ncbi:hypothetical protein WMF37_35110 [Sorangium sp. So ce291]|uniref:hypothetical protein n=1 Tax=Sorangium sp. So ce291 TaxID=3133294 RepID=UPI003F641DAD
MTSKILSLYSLIFNPVRPDVPVEALHVTPQVHTFLRRVESGVTDGGFALVSGDPGTGKSNALRLVREHLGVLPDVTVGTIEHPQSRVPDLSWARRALRRANSRGYAHRAGHDVLSARRWLRE